jgi:hypothetical protein
LARTQQKQGILYVLGLGISICSILQLKVNKFLETISKNDKERKKQRKKTKKQRKKETKKQRKKEKITKNGRMLC